MSEKTILTQVAHLNRVPDSWGDLESLVLRELKQIDSEGRRRELSAFDTSSLSIDLTHNDYLGLRYDQEYLSEVRRRIRELPVASGGSRLLGGEHPIFSQLEASFSRFKACEASLFFPSGFSANEGICRAFGRLNVGVISDQLNHASIIDGLRGARLKPQQKYILSHNSLEHLTCLLKSSPYKTNLVFTESLFSMDGDRAPLREMKSICDQYGGILVVDEAHALGVFGKDGAGLISELGLSHESIISINPCGKGMGASGAFVSGPLWLRDLLINTAREFIYTTAPSPWVAAALMTSIDWMPKLAIRRLDLLQKAALFRQSIAAKGWDIAGSTSQIVPVVLGSESRAMTAQGILNHLGVIAKAIRPPTVPEGTCRLRFSLNWDVCHKHFEGLIELVKGVQL